MPRVNNTKVRIHQSDKGSGNRRRKNRRPKAKSRVKIYGDAGRQVLRDVSMLRRFINTEIHYVDQAAGTATVSNVATFVLMNAMQIGDTAQLRTGNSIKVDGLSIRYGLVVNATAIVTDVRVLVVMDKQPNGAIFTLGDLLSQYGALNAGIVSQYVPETKDRYKVLYDVTHTLCLNGDSANIVAEKNIGCSNHVLFYNASNLGTIADIVSNSIYFIYYSNQNVNLPNIFYHNRCWFVDN